jgi:hypothetical protein
MEMHRACYQKKCYFGHRVRRGYQLPAILIGFCLSQVRIGYKKKADRAQGGTGGLRSHQLSFVVKTAWALTLGKWPQKGVIWGLIHPEVVQFTK